MNKLQRKSENISPIFQNIYSTRTVFGKQFNCCARQPKYRKIGFYWNSPVKIYVHFNYESSFRLCWSGWPMLLLVHKIIQYKILNNILNFYPWVLTKVYHSQNWTDINWKATFWWFFFDSPHMCKKNVYILHTNSRIYAIMNIQRLTVIFERFALFFSSSSAMCVFFFLFDANWFFFSNYWKMLWEVHLGNSQNTKYKQQRKKATRQTQH